VEAATKIRGKYLEALEQDDFEVLPGATCVKGFLRTYAIFLKLDGDALVDAYKNNFEPQAEDTPLVRTEVANQRRMPTSVERKKKRVRRHQRGYALVAIVAIVVVALLAWFGASRGDDTASIGAENISTSTVSTVAGSGASSTLSTDEGDTGSTATTESVQATVSSSVDTTTATDSTSGAGTVKLVVKVTTGSCWLVIREDGENGAEVYAGTLSEGGKQTFESARRYWMNVGQPEVLTVSVGGKSYTLAAPAGAFLVTETGIERSQ
jgi:cytoskeleton protein RodZ